MGLLGAILQTAYRLRRHRLAAWSLTRWLGFLILACAPVVAIAAPFLWPVVLLGVLALLFGISQVWAARQDYLLFRAVHLPPQLDPQRLPVPPLPAEESLPVRASGWFTVEGKSSISWPSRLTSRRLPWESTS